MYPHHHPEQYAPPPDREWINTLPDPYAQLHAPLPLPPPHPAAHDAVSTQFAYAPVSLYPASDPVQAFAHLSHSQSQFTFSAPPLPLPLAPGPDPAPPLPNYYPPETSRQSNSDLYTLRSIQRQRKRELSNSTSSGVSTVAPSTLLGFAGRGGEGGSGPSTQPSSAGQPYSQSTSVEPSPPLDYPPLVGGAFDYFQPFPTSSSSSSSTPSPFNWSQPQLFPQLSPPILPPLDPPAASSYPVVPLPLSFSFSSAATTTTSSSARSCLPLASTSLPTPRSDEVAALVPPPDAPPPLPATTTDSMTSLTSPNLLPILARGLEIRRRHYSELPSPLSTNPARNKSRSTAAGAGRKYERSYDGSTTPTSPPSAAATGTVRARTRTKSTAGGAPTGPDAGIDDGDDAGERAEEDSWNAGAGRWRIGKNASGKKITSFEVARVVMRNLSARLLDALEGIDRRGDSRDRGSAASSPKSTSTSATCLPQELNIEVNGSSCLVCAGLASGTKSTTRSTTTTTNETDQARERGYEDTLSAAIDRFEQLSLVEPQRIKQEILDDLLPGRTFGGDGEDEDAGRPEWERLVHLDPDQVPDEFSPRALKCDVCNLVCGLASVEHTDASLGPRAFTVEVICARCDKLFKACSDCGGGGGRLSAGRWRCRELFPDGRKNCQLSHARNPTLNEISIVVSPVSSLSPSELDEAASECRKLFFNTRLGTLCRPEFMLKGDGLASSFHQAENLSIDYWGRLEETLRGDLPPNSPMKRYLVITYSQRRPRHPPKSSTTTAHVKEEAGPDGNFDYEYDLGEPKPAPPPKSTRQSTSGGTGVGKMTPWAFSIVEVDFSVGVLFFCCVIPWATSGQSFDANSLLIERINERVKSDLVSMNASRQALALAPYPRLRYNFIVSPFRLDSKNSQNLNRRGFYTLDQLEEIEDEGAVDRTLFPPHRPIWLPAHCESHARAMHVFVRKLENEQDLGGPPPQNAPRKRKKKLNATL
ncbi:hypothetical protein JCM11491_006032 [Sporobolomyces phaffii]